MNQDLIAKVASLEESGGLLSSAAKNMKTWLEGGFLSETSLTSIGELLDAGIHTIGTRLEYTIYEPSGGVSIRGLKLEVPGTRNEKESAPAVDPALTESLKALGYVE